MKKIAHYGYFFVCEKFHEQIPIKITIYWSFCYVIVFVIHSYKLEMYSNQPLHYSNVHQFHSIMIV